MTEILYLNLNFLPSQKKDLSERTIIWLNLAPNLEALKLGLCSTTSSHYAIKDRSSRSLQRRFKRPI